MKALIIGNGGREHALAWKIKQSPLVKKVFVAPGNGGTDLDERIENIDIAVNDINKLVLFAKKEKIDLTIIGPEVPLSEGIVDIFIENKLKVFGPRKLAAQLESSKDFAKSFMERHKIPTAKYKTFTNIKDAHRYIKEEGAPIVIKADGLAAGKGVVVAMTVQEALLAVDSMLEDNLFGDAGARVVIEEFLTGEEVSFIVICDGKSILPLESSQDHKRLLDSDLGPNTGGMGAYSPAPIITPELHRKIMSEVIEPTTEGMKKDGIEFTGFLYAGLMIDKNNDIKTLEFNCRMGDPETQPILFRLKSDLFEILLAAANRNISNYKAEWDQGSAITVVIAAENYPNQPKINDEIFNHNHNNNNNDNCFIFHAGTVLKNNKIYSAGGRVLGVTAKGNSLKNAQEHVYNLVKNISFKGMQYRTDIAQKALKKSSERS
ncbi:phosphoribosylamine--glycine ligase [Methylophilaceae bacterium]|nr:phosphoribosylamine--glycine ligase [Methylophilaceae bacterium]